MFIDYLYIIFIAIAPNLTTLVGELVGARLIAHAGSLMNLAKQPASTIQILGAEKALFRALKTKHNTPKYGLIYHASLIGQAAPKSKAKIARMLATKSAIALRVDALGETENADVGIEGRTKVETRIRMLENRANARVNRDKSSFKQEKFQFKKSSTYNAENDAVMTESAPVSPPEEPSKKRKADEEEAAKPAEAEDEQPKAKKAKKEKKDKKDKKEKKKSKKEKE